MIMNDVDLCGSVCYAMLLRSFRNSASSTRIFSCGEVNSLKRCHPMCTMRLSVGVTSTTKSETTGLLSMCCIVAHTIKQKSLSAIAEISSTMSFDPACESLGLH
jgi:hypothetical protein